MRRLAAAAAALVAGASVTAVVLASEGASTNPRALAVELDEWGLSASRRGVPAGKLELTQRNTGRLDHELLIVRTNLAPDALPVGLEGPKPSLAGDVVYGVEHSHHGAAAARADHLAPGESRRETIELRAGRYVLLCGIEGHYEAGQRTALTVGVERP